MNRYIKKVTCILSVAAMLCGLGQFAAAETEVMAVSERKAVVTLSEKYTKESGLLYSLGIIDNMETDADKKINRSEFLSMVLKATNNYFGETEGNVFLDVTAEDWFYYDVYSAYAQGIVSVLAPYLFRPYDIITGNEAASMLVSAMGYKDMALMRGGYPTGYMSVTNLLKIDNKGTGEMTFGDGVKMIADALESNYFEKSYVNATSDSAHSVKFTEDTELMYMGKNFNVYALRGIVTATPNSKRLYGDSYTENMITIDGKDYAYNGKIAIADDILGKNVRFYLNVENGTESVIYIYPDQKRNTEIIIEKDDFIPTGSLTSVKYYDDNDAERTVNISRTAKTFYNGRIETGLVPDDFIVNDGYIRLIDNNNDKTYDYVFIYNLEYGVVQSSANGKIAFKYGHDKLDVNNDGKFYLFRDGIEITCDYIGEWDVLTLAMTKDGKGGRIDVTCRKEEGTVESVKTKDGETTVVINETEYKLSKIFKDAIDKKNVYAIKPLKGLKVAFVYNDDNVIFGVSKDYTHEFQYGFLTAVNGSTEGWGEDDKPQAKIFSTLGSMNIYNCKNNMKVDGVKISGELKNYFMVNGKFKPQLVMYKLNANNELVEIKTAVDATASGYNRDEFSLDYAKYNSSWTGNTTLHTVDNYYVSPIEITHVFYVPADITNDDRYMYYHMYGNETYVSTKSTDIEMYDMIRYKEDLNFTYMSVIVLYERPEDIIDGSSNPFVISSIADRGNHAYFILVTDIETIVDEDTGVLATKLSGQEFTRTGPVDFIGYFKDPAYNCDTGSCYGAGYKKAEEIGIGDLIRISYVNPLSSNLLIDKFYVAMNSDFYGDLDFEKIYLYSQTEVDMTNPSAAAGMVVYGTVEYVSQNEMIVKTKDGMGRDKYYIGVCSNSYVYAYSSQKDKITRSAVNNIGEGDRVAVRFSSATAFDYIFQIVD